MQKYKQEFIEFMVKSNVLKIWGIRYKEWSSNTFLY